MKHVKKAFSACLTLCLLAGLLPWSVLPARAEELYEDDLWVGGVDVVAAERQTVFDENGGSAALTYDAEGRPVLTLTDYTYSGEGSYGAAICYYYSEPLTIVLSGENSVEQTGGSSDSCGIYSTAGLTIIGDGSLTVAGGTPTRANGCSYGILVDGGEGNTIETGVRISGGTVTARGGTANDGVSCGVRGSAAGTGVLIEGGTVDAAGGSGASSYGIDGYGFVGVEITGGAVNAEGGESKGSNGMSCGVCGETYGGYTREGVLITGGRVTATGGTASGDDGKSYGLYGYGGSSDDGEFADVSIGADVVRVIASGYTNAIWGHSDDRILKCKIEGTGFQSANGTGAMTDIWESGNDFYTSAGSDGLVRCRYARFPVLVEYPLWVGGTRVDSDNAADIPAAVGEKTGTASYDAKTNTLTLTNYTYSGAAACVVNASTKYAVIYYSGSEPLTVALSGENSVTEVIGSEEEFSRGILSLAADLTITGDGSLTVVSGAANQSIAIECANDSSLEIGGSVAVTASGGAASGDDSESYGVYCENSLTVGTGAALTADGGTSEGLSYGVYCYENAILAAGSALIAAGGTLAVEASVQNAEPGVGYENADGTGAETWIPVGGCDTSSCKKVVFPAPAATVALSDADGGAVRFTVTNAPAGALLIAARYDGGRLTAVKTTEDFSAGQLTLGGSGADYLLTLADGTTLAPLCAAARSE